MMFNYGFAKPFTFWSEHHTHGGTGITKFDADHLPLYQKAIAELGDSQVFLKGNELHSSRTTQDLSDFWEVYRRVKATALANSTEQTEETK